MSITILADMTVTKLLKTNEKMCLRSSMNYQATIYKVISLEAVSLKKAPTRRKQGAVTTKSFVTKITLCNYRVCKEFFLKTLDILNRRFATVSNKISQEGFVELDKRGKHPPRNKLPIEKKNEVVAHNNQFPRYKSHYSRAQNENTRYLSETLNISVLYRLYCE